MNNRDVHWPNCHRRLIRATWSIHKTMKSCSVKRGSEFAWKTIPQLWTLVSRWYCLPQSLGSLWLFCLFFPFILSLHCHPLSSNAYSTKQTSFFFFFFFLRSTNPTLHYRIDLLLATLSVSTTRHFRGCWQSCGRVKNWIRDLIEIL